MSQTFSLYSDPDFKNDFDQIMNSQVLFFDKIEKNILSFQKDNSQNKIPRKIEDFFFNNLQEEINNE